jgi:hypothetical protein
MEGNRREFDKVIASLTGVLYKFAWKETFRRAGTQQQVATSSMWRRSPLETSDLITRSVIAP